MIAITLDDYVVDEWAPTDSTLKATVLDRVVADFRSAAVNKSQYDKAIGILLNALRRGTNLGSLSQ